MRKSRLSRVCIEKILEHFIAGTPACSCAKLLGIHHTTSTAWYHKLHIIILVHLEKTSLYFDGEVDESYFGRRQKGKKEEELQET